MLIIDRKLHFDWSLSYHDYVSGLDRDLIVTSGFKGIERSVIHHLYILLCRNCKWAFFYLQRQWEEGNKNKALHGTRMHDNKPNK